MFNNAPPHFSVGIRRKESRKHESHLPEVCGGWPLGLSGGGLAFLDPPCDNSCPDTGRAGVCHRGGGEAAGAGDGQSGIVAYPYYTTHGPRDYFAKPTDIGP